MVTDIESLIKLVVETSSRPTARVIDRDANEYRKIYISGARRVATKYTSGRLFRIKKANYLNQVALDG